MPEQIQPEKIDVVRLVMNVISSRGGFPTSSIKFDSKYVDVGVGDTGIRSSLLAIRRYIKRFKPEQTIKKVELINAKNAGALIQLVIQKILSESETDETVKSLMERV